MLLDLDNASSVVKSTSILLKAGYGNKTLYNSKIKLVNRNKLIDLGIVTRIIDLKTYDYLYIKDKNQH